MGLDNLVVVVGVADRTAVGEEDEPSAVVQGLSPAPAKRASPAAKAGSVSNTVAEGEVAEAEGTGSPCSH